MLQFFTLIFFFISVLVTIFLTFYMASLQTFFLTLPRLQTIYFVFSDHTINVFQYFLCPLPSRKNNSPALKITSRKEQYIRQAKLHTAQRIVRSLIMLISMTSNPNSSYS